LTRKDFVLIKVLKHKACFGVSLVEALVALLLSSITIAGSLQAWQWAKARAILQEQWTWVLLRTQTLYDRLRLSVILADELGITVASHAQDLQACADEVSQRLPEGQMRFVYQASTDQYRVRIQWQNPFSQQPHHIELTMPIGGGP